MQKIQLAILALLSTLLQACGTNGNQVSSQADFLAVYQNINDATLKQHTRTLSSDEFEGRLPTTLGEQRTLEHLIAEFKKRGYQPGNHSS
jgi:hypothetical protein